MKWSFYQVWNKTLEEGQTRTLVPRQKIWASELGGAYIDRFLKMKGVQPSNPPNPRSKRKFEAGNIWEAIIRYVLRRAGILLDYQKWLGYQYEGLLPVSGKLDFIAGGKPDYDQALFIISKEFGWLPEFISRATKNIINWLRTEYPDGLEIIVLEAKSCSSYMFEKYERTQDASIQHKLQTFHYLKANPLSEGHIVYICKDDARLLEVEVLNPSDLEKEYRHDIEFMTECIFRDWQPPKEKFIVFDKTFSANWKVAYSQYLTYLYGFKDQFEFDKKYKPMTERWNRVLGRIREKKRITKHNKKVIREITDFGFNIEEL